jgi:membrane-associated protease RseP (regulator of RpoE activity)
MRGRYHALARAARAGNLGGMRRTGVWLGLCGLLLGCEGLAPETSPATMPARLVEAPTLTPPAIDPAVMAAAVRGGVRQRSANEGLYEVDAFLAALVVEDLRSARPSVTLAPVVENGLQIGYRITGVREGSVYGAVGLLDGDVIESINGVVLEGPDQVAGAILASERVAALQVTRAGVSSVRELRVAPGLAWQNLLTVRSGAAPAELAAGTGPNEPGPPDLSGEPVDPPVLPVLERPQPGKPSKDYMAGKGQPGWHPPQTGKPAQPAGGTAPASGAIQCAGDGSCTISRREFDAAVADPDKLTKQVQISPAPGGYRLYGIRNGSQVSQLGFRNGDIIKSVNGTSVDDQFGLLALYSGLGSTSSYRVGFQRGGSTQSKTIRIR